MNSRRTLNVLLLALMLAAPISPAGAVVIVSGCASSSFCSLDELTPGGGGSITVDGVSFSDFINIDLTREINSAIQMGNIANVQVFGDDADALRPTITFVLNGELTVPGSDPFDDAMLSLDFDVATTDASDMLTGFGLTLGVRAFTLLDQGAVQVRGDAENPPGTNIPPTGTLQVEEDRRDSQLLVTSSDLFGTSQSILEGGLDANVFVDVANNAVSLETFSYFVTQSSVSTPLPEPSTLALSAIALAALWMRSRRRQTNL